MPILKDTNFLRVRDLERSEALSDLQIVCQDGVTSGQQVLMSNHSNFLKQLFLSSSPLRDVSLMEVPGLPSKLKVWVSILWKVSVQSFYV